ncbi:hypothetical protein, partial [Rikenella microfusus]|uniref:hypothetical protein n=1 Tax=Rikenella microfusus TaxID=28139 RepID=UPI003AB1A940
QEEGEAKLSSRFAAPQFVDASLHCAFCFVRTGAFMQIQRTAPCSYKTNRQRISHPPGSGDAQAS